MHMFGRRRTKTTGAAPDTLTPPPPVKQQQEESVSPLSTGSIDKSPVPSPGRRSVGDLDLSPNIDATKIPTTKAVVVPVRIKSFHSDTTDGDMVVKVQAQLKSEALVMQSEGNAFESILGKIGSVKEKLRTTSLEIRSMHRNITKYSDRQISIEDALSSESELCLVPVLGNAQKSFEQLLDILQKQPGYLGKLFVNYSTQAKQLGASRADFQDLVDAVLFSLFGSVFYRSSEKYLLLFLQQVIQLTYTALNKVTALFSSDPVKLLLQQYSLRTGSKYLINVLREPLIEALQRESFGAELDPKVIATLLKNSCSLTSNPAKVEQEAEQIAANNAAHLLSVCSQIASNLYENAKNLPYGIRWIARQIYTIGNEKFPPNPDKPHAENAMDMVKKLVLLRFVIPAVHDPDMYGIITDFPITMDARIKLGNIEKVITNLSYGVPFPQHSPLSIMNRFIEVDQEKIAVFFQELMDVPDPDEYFMLPHFGWEDPQLEVLITGRELNLLYSLVTKDADANVDGGGRRASESQVESEAAALRQAIEQKCPNIVSTLEEYPDKVLVINDSNYTVDQFVKDHPAKVQEDDPLGPARLKLRRLLCQVGCLVGSRHLPLLGLLEEEYVTQKVAKEAHFCIRDDDSESRGDPFVEVALLADCIHTLRQVPTEQHRDILKGLEEEYQERNAKLSSLVFEKQKLLLRLEQLEEQCERLDEELRVFIAYLQSERFRPFFKHIEEDVKGFMVKFRDTDGVDSRLSKLKGFFSKSVEKILSFPAMTGASEAEHVRAAALFERYVMSRISEFAFPQSREDLEADDELAKKIGKLSHLKPTDPELDIPPRYANPSQWVFCHEQFVKLAVYRTPRDKARCILNACRILLSIIKFEGEDPSADVYVPILAFIILQTNPRRLHSNLQYILNYYHVTDNEISNSDLNTELWLSHFEFAIDFIRSMEVADDENPEATLSPTVTTVPDADGGRFPLFREPSGNVQTVNSDEFFAES
eukprot:GFYU01001734.1.p1 GENE.GFYU01001734.1~~GFYU01001734.1.p1  ORF type:complete len:989 (+),score=288.78 GFYU01001734.1:130-3096(+)